MNVQEAIDLMERELEIFKEKYNKHKQNKTTLEQFYKNKVEALSIVLESVKKLQEIKDKALSYAFIKDIDCSNVELYDFAKWVYDKAEGFEVEE